MRPTIRILCSLTLCSNLLQSVPAAAQQPEDAQAPAHLQYRKAFELMNEKHWVEARRLLLDLWLKSRTYDVAASLGQIEYQLRNYSLAARYLAFALANVPPMEKPETVARFQEAFTEVKKLVAVAELALLPPEAVPYVDGAAVDTSLGNSVYLDPGVHNFEARLGAGNSTARVLDLEAGEVYKVELQVNPNAPSESDGAAPPAPISGGHNSPEPARNERSLIPVYVGAGVTAVGVGLALAFGSAARSARNDAQTIRERIGASGCRSGAASMADCAAALDAYDRQRADATLAKVGVGIAVVGGVATAGYLVYAIISDQKTRDAQRVRPMLAFDGRALGMSVSGSF